MTRKQCDLLKEIHMAVLDPETGLKRQMNWLVNDISVNGEKGIENILRSTHGNIEGLKEITYTLKTKRDLKIMLGRYIQDRPIIKIAFGVLTDKRVLIFIIGALLTWLGRAEIGTFFINLF